jgi:hypothetical protein
MAGKLIAAEYPGEETTFVTPGLQRKDEGAVNLGGLVFHRR